MTPVASRTVRAAAAPDGTALETARRQLERALAAAAPDAARPYVVTLGVHDALGPRAADPFAALRPAATVHLGAQAVLLGPWGGDGTAPACGQCLAMRWQRLRSRSERDALETGSGPRTPVSAHWPRLSPYVLDAVAALHAAVLGGDAKAPGPLAADRALPQVSRLDLETLQVRTYPLAADPLCPDCGPRGADAPRPFVPASRPKPAPQAQRLRKASSYPVPREALANPVTGVLGGGTWINVTSPTTAPVAGSVFMRGYAGLTDVTWSGQANSFSASRDLAFLEGLERYAGTHRRTGAEALTASYAELGERALNPAECGFYPPATYRDDPLVSPFDPERPIPWVYGHSLRDDRPVLVPARLAYYSAGLAADNFVFECSNGCAIGGCLEEAVLGALLELIERDAFLLAWYGGQRLTEIDLDSVPGPAVRMMVDRAALQGYDVHAFDNRIDLAVPVVTGLAVRRDGGPGLYSFGAGAALDPAAAVEAALSEVLTYIPHLPRQVAERQGELEAMAGDFGLVRHLKDHAQLYGLPAMAPHARTYREPLAVRPMAELYERWEAHGRPRTGDLRDDLLLCVGELTGAGHDVIVVDQTTPEQRRMGLHTVCAIVPGLLPIDFGWSRQRAPYMPRLRTAAQRAGLRESALTDAEIRLVPHPFP
ncbi:TOMM precursor leader peptide-binding protein [Streptomyces sp. NBC_00091]|uniref:TOMM precursor leader peptide-binding protein n=1 Tax=Streptomyces sp. NBC_00091 TaxID=2975648 RepID=UPI00224F17A7|nr:TOMM precursor leader peptide-binding protein [Streptomyces sp. NBC_00091]MCX5380605.1 TOMM precursor leader peptide-binding protein [Streptomyces sp. NBC_00091]